MLKSEKVATPFTAVTVLVPDRVPGMSKPPLFAVGIVPRPLKRATGLPRASSAVTFTGGRIVMNGSVVLGWTVMASCVAAGFSTSAVASHVLGELKYQLHCGSTEPAPACTK